MSWCATMINNDRLTVHGLPSWQYASIDQHFDCSTLRRVAERCVTLQRVAERCGAMRCVAARCGALRYVTMRYDILTEHNLSSALPNPLSGEQCRDALLWSIMTDLPFIMMMMTMQTCNHDDNAATAVIDVVLLLLLSVLTTNSIDSRLYGRSMV